MFIPTDYPLWLQTAHPLHFHSKWGHFKLLSGINTKDTKTTFSNKRAQLIQEKDSLVPLTVKLTFLVECIQAQKGFFFVWGGCLFFCFVCLVFLWLLDLISIGKPTRGLLTSQMDS